MLLMANYTSPTSPRVHIAILKEEKKSIVVFQCPLFIELNMADAKDESNDRNDCDGNATRSTSEASQVKV